MTGDPSSAAVEVQELLVSVAGTKIPVVADVSFAIQPGEVMGMVGESGSGKSTVGLALLAYARRGLEISSGEVRIAGVDLLSLPDRAAQRLRGAVVSYVPQDPGTSLNPAHRVGTQLREALEIHQDDLPGLDVAERVDELLEDVALPNSVLRSFPHQLSGGQQQRIGVAIAFACRPRLVVLDEPTTGLDVTTQRHVLETVRALAEAYGVSALYISHDLPAVAQIADWTAVMYGGRIVEYAPTPQLFAEPRHPYTAGLLAAAPSPFRSTRLVGIEGYPPRPGRWPKGCSFANRCRWADDVSRAGVPPLERTGNGGSVRCVHPLEGGTLAVLAGTDSPKPSPGSGVSLQITDLTADYGGPPVLHGLSFDAISGLCTAIVGESGSGKTTLARCVAGLHSRWSGEIRVGTAAVPKRAAQRTNDQRRLMQYVFQNPFASLNPSMTVLENIEEPLRYFERLRRRERRRRALDVLPAVALTEEFAGRLPSQLSGGERQRVALGRALVVDPEVLICDEITSALDVSVQAQVIEQLRDLQLQRGLSMVFITHNLAVVRSLAQHVIVLQHGTIVERGSVDKVLGDPQHPYTRQLLEDVPHIPGIEDRAAV